jgi:hypothetical protein
MAFEPPHPNPLPAGEREHTESREGFNITAKNSRVIT